MKQQITIILIILTLGFSQKINLNSATLEELQILELTDDQIESILDYRSRSGYIHNIYDLLNLTNITINNIHAIRNAVTVDIPQASTFEKDMARASYKMGKWISNEGSTEGLSEVWLDKFFEPQNINNMNYDDLMALPNLSPVDVTAVLKQKNRGYINGTWELKNSPGISYWGYKNLVDFIRLLINQLMKADFMFALILWFARFQLHLTRTMKEILPHSKIPACQNNSINYLLH